MNKVVHKKAKAGWLLIVPILLWVTACSNGDSRFEVAGEITGLNNSTVYLESLNISSIDVIDSGSSDEKGRFKLKGTSNEPGLFRLRLPGDRYVLLSLDKGKVEVKGNLQNLENYTVSGSAPSASLKQYLSVVRNYMADFNTLYIVLDSLKVRGNDSLLEVAYEEAETKNAEFTQYIERYADTVEYLPNALFAVQMLNPDAEEKYLTSFSSSLEKRFPNSVMAKEFNGKLKEMMISLKSPKQEASAGLDIGALAPDIELPGINGNLKKLSDYRGKFVLIDFWASWCGPCRAENPNVVRAFYKMKDKNFTILGVSLDNDKSKWKSAIEADGLKWDHISDLKGWESIAARDYNIQSIPANFLINPEGKIIAKNLRGDQLEETLNQLVQ